MHPTRMTHRERAAFLRNERSERDTIMSITNKGGEYTRLGNANDNFYRVAHYLGITPEEAVIVYLLKHLDAILNTAKTGKSLTEDTRSRLHDLANYVEILHAIMHERGLA